MYSEENHISVGTTNLELLGENKERKINIFHIFAKILAQQYMSFGWSLWHCIVQKLKNGDR